MFMERQKYTSLLDKFTIDVLLDIEDDVIIKIEEHVFDEDIIDCTSKSFVFETLNSELNKKIEAIEVEISIQDKGHFIPKYELSLNIRGLLDGMISKVDLDNSTVNASNIIVFSKAMDQVKRIYELLHNSLERAKRDIKLIGWDSEIAVVDNAKEEIEQIEKLIASDNWVEFKNKLFNRYN